MVLKKAYVRTPWFWLSMVIAVGGVVDIILLLYTVGFLDHNEHLDENVRLLSGLQFIRQLHALEVRLPDNCMNACLCGWKTYECFSGWIGKSMIDCRKV